MQRQTVLYPFISSFLILFFLVPSVSAQGPSISLNPDSGEPGSGVSVTGSGFVPDVPCELVFGNYGTLANFSSDPNGGVNTSFNVPGQAAPGATPVQVNCPQAQQSAGASFNVLQSPPPTNPPPTNPSPVQPTKTCQQVQNCTPTPTPPATTGATGSNNTPTPTATKIPTETPALAATTVSHNPPAPAPTGNPNQWSVIFGRLLPTWVLVVVGLWLAILIGFLLLWLFGRNPVPDVSNPPQDLRQRSRRPSKKAWGTATVMWLVVGSLVSVSYIALSRVGVIDRICGIDDFPDWVVKSIDLKKNDDIVITVANIGICPAPSILGHWNWGKTKVENPYVDPYGTVIGAAPGYEPTPPLTGDPDRDAWRGWGAIVFLNRLPVLVSGESTTFTVHIELSYYYLTHGESRFGYILNYPREYKEDDYYNNSLVVP